MLCSLVVFVRYCVLNTTLKDSVKKNKLSGLIYQVSCGACNLNETVFKIEVNRT